MPVLTPMPNAIVDTAASVHFVSMLDRLLPINVGGPLNLLRLAADTRPKALHLSSSYAVFNEASYQGVSVVMEDPLIGDGVGFRNSYPASKWIAERVTDLARERGFNITTHRLGVLWGDARTGRSKPDDREGMRHSARAHAASRQAGDILSRFSACVIDGVDEVQKAA